MTNKGNYEKYKEKLKAYSREYHWKNRGQSPLPDGRGLNREV